jgi:hypothetical protein
MTHYSVLVIGPETQVELDAALAPFDETIEVDPYIRSTKADQIKTLREDIVRGVKSKVLYDNKLGPYDRPITTLAHIKWITQTVPMLATASDDELWEYILKEYPGEDRDEHGNVWSTYNPKSQWDWYKVGGRWFNMLKIKANVEPTYAGSPAWGLSSEDIDPKGVNIVKKLADLDLEATPKTYALLLPNGEWHERGKVGWFKMGSDVTEQDGWGQFWETMVDTYSEHPAWLVDCHI